MRPFVLSLMILSILAGCPATDQAATPTATAETEADAGECTPDRADGSAASTATPTATTPTTPAVRTTPVVPTATPSVTPTATPTENSTR